MSRVPIKTYIKKPVAIEAIQYTGGNWWDIVQWVRECGGLITPLEPVGLQIKTLEGIHKASLNDFIIKGIKGEFYPCKPDIFEMTYVEQE